MSVEIGQKYISKRIAVTEVALRVVDVNSRYAEVEIFEHQLGHSVRDPNGRAYNRTTHIKARANMMQTYADYLDKLRRDKV